MFITRRQPYSSTLQVSLRRHLGFVSRVHSRGAIPLPGCSAIAPSATPTMINNTSLQSEAFKQCFVSLNRYCPDKGPTAVPPRPTALPFAYFRIDSVHVCSLPIGTPRPALSCKGTSGCGVNADFSQAYRPSRCILGFPNTGVAERRCPQGTSFHKHQSWKAFAQWEQELRY